MFLAKTSFKKYQDYVGWVKFFKFSKENRLAIHYFKIPVFYDYKFSKKNHQHILHKKNLIKKKINKNFLSKIKKKIDQKKFIKFFY